MFFYFLCFPTGSLQHLQYQVQITVVLWGKWIYFYFTHFHIHEILTATTLSQDVTLLHFITAS